MISEPIAQGQLLTAFVVGLMGGVHCVGMCGGIVTALSFSMEGPGGVPRARFPILLGYNFGRLFSYVLLGVVAGWLGSAALGLGNVQNVRIAAQLLSVAIMVAMGLYLGGWWFGLTRVERVGARLWKHVEPLGRRFIPVKNPGAAVILGGIWGWLPCGLVYSMLIWALTAASPEQGGLIMLAFGLGTLPNLLLMGVFAARIGAWLKDRRSRRLAGIIVLLLAAWQLYTLVLIAGANQ